MPVGEIKSLSEFQAIINSGKVVFIDFTARWCGPCKFISPIFHRLAEENAREGVEFYKVDVDDASDVAQECGIRAMPTFAVFQSGAKIGDLVGADVAELQALIKNNLQRL